ncbi:MAG: hypothetical protein PVG71_14075 [Anaerolineae bacterium]
MTTKSMPSALLDFRRARRQAELESLLARLSGKSVDLLCYDDVQDKMHGTRAPRSELRDIELDRIVGSVGRCTDFTRSFLPLQDSDERRWARADLKMDELSGLPPIEVYELGGVYFVQEGHHRVSVARHSGATHLQAHVTMVRGCYPAGRAQRVPFENPSRRTSARIQRGGERTWAVWEASRAY